jgi:hypothetical protein
MWLHWVYYVVLLLVLFTGLVLTLFSLPGNWVMVLAVILDAWLAGWLRSGKWWIVSLLAVAVLAEVVEFLAAGRGAKKAGGTIWGTVGALLGTVLGGLLLTGLIPIPIIGTLAGIILGTFLGAMAAEFIGGKDLGRSALVGVGAATGRFVGTLLKLASGCIILIVSLIAALPLGRNVPPTVTTPPVSPPVVAPK